MTMNSSKNYRTAQHPPRQTLTLEPLESRILLTQIIEGIDPDGDAYQIKLTGPGTITTAELDRIVTAGTTLASGLSVSVTDPQGNGLVNVGAIDTTMANIGRITIEGNLGGLDTQKINNLKAESLSPDDESTAIFNILDRARKIDVNAEIENAVINIGANLGTLNVGHRLNDDANIYNSQILIAGKANSINLKQSLTAGSSITVNGALKRLNIDKSIVNSTLSVGQDLDKLSVKVSVRQQSAIDIGGECRSLQIRKDLSDSDLNVFGAVKKLKIGNDLANASLNVGQIDSLSIKDDINNVLLNIEGDLDKCSIGDVSQFTLRVGGNLDKCKIRRDLQAAVVSVLHNIGSIRIGQELNRSTIMAGIDIGPDLQIATDDDLEWGDLEVDSIVVGGDMIDSSIAAGVKTSLDNTDPYYGNGNDVRAYLDGTAGTAHISKIIVRGEITTTDLPGESYAITADDGIDTIKSRGREFTGAPGVIKQEF